MSEEVARQLWDQAANLPHGLPKVELLDQAIREADQAAWEEGSYDIRVDMMEAATFSGASERLLAAFSWCLGMADERPDLYDDSDLLWQYKWAISGALNFTGVSRPQMESMLDDFSLRLKKYGYTQRSAVGLRVQMHQLLGQLDLATEVAREWLSTDRDEMADCEACEINHLVSLACDRSEHALAMKQAEPLLQGKLSCAEIPHETYPELLISAVEQDLLDEAKRMHIRGYRLVYRGSDFLRALGMHAVYLARVRDVKKGLDLVQKHMSWAMTSLESHARCGFFTGALAVARVCRANGAARIPLQLPNSHPLAEGEQCDVQAFIGWLEHEVELISQAFDRRNGTSFCSDQVQRWLRIAHA